MLYVEQGSKVLLHLFEKKNYQYLEEKGIV